MDKNINEIKAEWRENAKMYLLIVVAILFFGILIGNLYGWMWVYHNSKIAIEERDDLFQRYEKLHKRFYYVGGCEK
jgi:predicted negative regulator of RcsB-dependent stress response